MVANSNRWSTKPYLSEPPAASYCSNTGASHGVANEETTLTCLWPVQIKVVVSFLNSCPVFLDFWRASREYQSKWVRYIGQLYPTDCTHSTENPVSALMTAMCTVPSHFWVPTSLPHPIHNQKLSVPPEDFWITIFFVRTESGELLDPRCRIMQMIHHSSIYQICQAKRCVTYRGMLEKIACMI